MISNVFACYLPADYYWAEESLLVLYLVDEANKKLLIKLKQMTRMAVSIKMSIWKYERYRKEWYQWWEAEDDDYALDDEGIDINLDTSINITPNGQIIKKNFTITSKHITQA